MSHREHTDKIRMAFDDGRAGYRDEDALRVISHAAAGLRYSPLSSYAQEKLGEVERYADIYFSPRKHLRRRGGLPKCGFGFFEL